jgi:hypothetical protein
MDETNINEIQCETEEERLTSSQIERLESKRKTKEGKEKKRRQIERNVFLKETRKTDSLIKARKLLLIETRRNVEIVSLMETIDTSIKINNTNITKPKNTNIFEKAKKFFWSKDTELEKLRKKIADQENEINELISEKYGPRFERTNNDNMTSASAVATVEATVTAVAVAVAFVDTEQEDYIMQPSALLH